MNCKKEEEGLDNQMKFSNQKNFWMNLKFLKSKSQLQFL